MTALDLLADAVDEVANAVYTAPDLLQLVGWRRALFSAVRSDATAIRTVAEFIRAQVGKDVSEIDWAELFEQLKGIKDAIDSSLAGQFRPGIEPAVAEEALTDLLHLTALRLIVEQSRLAAEALTFLEVFRREFAPELRSAAGDVLRVRSYRMRLVPERFVDLFRGGRGLVSAIFGVGDSGTAPGQEELAIAMLLVIRGVLDSLGLLAILGPTPAPVPPQQLGGRQVAALWPRSALRNDEGATASVNLAVSFEQAAGIWPSVVLGVGGTARVPFTQASWKGELTVTGGPLAIVIGKDVLEVRATSLATAELNLLCPSDAATANNGSPFIFGDRALRALLGASTAGVLAEAGASARNNQLRIKPSADDGFLKTILPAEGIGLAFDLDVGWSSKRGFTVSGGIGFHQTIAVNKNIAGVITIDNVEVDMRGDLTKPAITASAAVSGAITLGPVRGVVEQMGLQIALAFPAAGGNLGAADLSFGFKPPKGIALSVKAAAVKGGGYLFFDYVKGEYAGVAHLEITGGYGLTAVGILNTRMPGGEEGFSLLLIVSLTLGSGIALSFGFFLTGLGGLLGVNRDYQEDEIRRGISDGTIDSILFPPDPIVNARKVVADAGRVFPPAQGKFVIGLMARITWGQPKMLTGDLGLIVALPDVVITLIGRLRLDLPDPEKAVLALRVTFQGTLSFPKRRLTFDATLAGSKLLTFAITGQMGMLLKWGDDPTFAMSIGGFHPKFQPPAELNITTRMGIAIFSEKDLRLRLGTYFALTTNTLQLGVELDFYLAKDLGFIGNFEIQAGAGFDALIQFSPFHFVISAYGRVTVARNGAVLVALSLSCSVEGPGRWIIDGELYLKVLAWEVRLPLHQEFGDEPPVPLPPAKDVEQLVLDEVAKAGSWSATLPERSESSLMFRDISGETTLVLHPFGTLTVRQRVAPLRITLTKFGESRIEGADRIEFSEAVVSNLARAGATATDLFARGQFFVHPDGASDDQKVQEPQFETFACGLQGIGGLGFTAPLIGQVDSLDYETLVIDDPVMPAAAAPGMAAGLSVADAATRSSSSRLAGQRLVDRSVDRRVLVSEPQYVAMEADGSNLGTTSAATKTGFTQAQNGTRKGKSGRRERVVPEWDIP